uniref:Peripheral subunit-binding (PSBD) domain-containing protein n=1 Tax=Brassica campestris TaxID=3711 RepID=M4CQJ7_BRACM
MLNGLCDFLKICRGRVRRLRWEPRSVCWRRLRLRSIEEPQSKAASKSSSASPVVVPSPPPPTASSPAPAIAQHAPVATVSDGPRKTVATPYAKKLAKQHKVDIRSVAGTGPFGRITASDVEAAAGIAPSVAAPPPPVVNASCKAQRWSTTATGHQQGNNTLVTNKMYSLQPIHVMAGQEISGKLHLVVHRKSVGPSADKGGILHTSSCKFNLKEPYYRMSQPSCTRTTSTTVKVKLASTLDHIGNVAQLSPLIGFVHKHVVIVDTEPELEKSEFLVMSLEKCVKQLEEERATEETYHHQQRKCKL